MPPFVHKAPTHLIILHVIIHTPKHKVATIQRRILASIRLPHLLVPSSSSRTPPQPATTPGPLPCCRPTPTSARCAASITTSCCCIVLIIVCCWVVVATVVAVVSKQICLIHALIIIVAVQPTTLQLSLCGSGNTTVVSSRLSAAGEQQVLAQHMQPDTP
jgi:hypothetical protein